MSFSYENQGGNTFLVYPIGKGEQLDSMCAGVLTNNNIPGLIKAVFTQAGSNWFIRYNVSSMASVKQVFSGPVNKTRLLSVLHGIVDAILPMGQYRIDPDMIVLDTNYMFVDVSTGRIMLICLPIIRKKARQGVDFCAFFKQIMFTTQFDQTEDYDYVAKIISYLNSTAAFSLTQFKDLLSEISAEVSPAPAAMGTPGYPQGVHAVRLEKPQPQPIPIPGVPPVSPVRPAPSAPPSWPSSPAGWPTPPPPPTSPVPAAPAVPLTSPASAAPAAPIGAPPAQPGSPAFPAGGQQVQTPGAVGNFDATVPLDQGQPARQITPYLFRKRSGEKIPVTKPIFRIGRDVNYNDYPITDNIYVSHGHCHIISRDGEYYIVDDNSKNHTSVDGTKIPPEQEVKLTHGCEFIIANEKFEFMLY